MWLGRESAVARPATAGLVGLLALLLCWLYVVPAQAGGATSYAMIVGGSMEPELHRGDLVLVRPREDYRAGDVVLYDDHQLGSKVMHRIVRVEGDHYVLKGDNNDFLDTARPTREQIVGALWLTAPGVGRFTSWLQEPIHAALLVGLATLVALGGGAAAGAALTGRRRRPASEAPRRPRAPRQLSTLLPFACVVFGVLTVVSFTRPTSHVVTAERAYAHEGRLDYSAAVPRSPVYPDGSVTTGEPVFLRIVPRLRVEFDYVLASHLPASARGTIGLTAKLADGRGWSRVLQVAPEREFMGQAARVGGSIDLERVQRLTEQMQQLTGSSQGAFTFTVQPSVTIAGHVDEEAVEATFAPAVSFELADLRLQPKLDDAGATAFTQRRVHSGPESVPQTLRLGALELAVTAGRWLGAIGLVTSLLLAGLAFASERRRLVDEEASRIAARHGRLLVEVSAHAVDPARILDLPDVESLVRIALHHGRLILHAVERDQHVYLVEEGDTVFRYRTRPAAGEADTAEVLFGALHVRRRLGDVEA